MDGLLSGSDFVDAALGPEKKELAGLNFLNGKTRHNF